MPGASRTAALAAAHTCKALAKGFNPRCPLERSVLSCSPILRRKARGPERSLLPEVKEEEPGFEARPAEP